MSPGGWRAGAGYTLIELLVTVAVIGIILSLATAGYGQYVRRANRADASTALLRIASAQEKHYAQTGEYADNIVLDDAPPVGLGITGTERGYYALSIEIAPGGTSVGFTARATVEEDGPQAGDTDCWVLWVNERGQRGAEDQGGNAGDAITERCWR